MAVKKEILILPELVDALYAPQLLEIFQKSLEKKESLEIDGSKVEKLSTLNIQLILSALKSFKHIKKTILCVHPSDQFRQACNLILGDHHELFKE